MKERYLLVAVATQDPEAVWDSLEELSLLLETAGGEAAEGFVQNLAHPDPATYVGKGKAYELKDALALYDACGVVCDDELSPMQMKNLSDILEAKVLDRTMLILDIFAAHARTKEGKVQVEMAQLKYRLSRLRGAGMALSRLGGGIGTRGPGETKLESDRRAIHRRLSALSGEMETMKNARETTRKRRTESAHLMAAVVGYTNAGKSTLLNRLTGAELLAENKLFATLDPATRVCIMPNGEEILLTDTVGFINKLPHQLIDAFRSTLEESRYADFILHVVDLSDENVRMHMDVVYQTLDALDVKGKPVITVYNKEDLVDGDDPESDPRAEYCIRMSAKTGQGVEDLYAAIEDLVRRQRKYIDCVFPYDQGGTVAQIRKYGQILTEEYVAEGIRVEAYVPAYLGIK